MILRDNGLRTFVPPCFNWELVSPAGETVETVSEIDLTAVHVSMDDVVVHRLFLTGRTESYSTQFGQQGVRLVVESVERTT